MTTHTTPHDEDAYEARRTSFGSAAERYDANRPSYPAAMWDDLLGPFPKAARVLEIGAGTGKASVEMARRGFGITALEPGSAMAAVWRRNMAPYPSTEVMETRLEDWKVEPHAYSLVVAAQSFHWVRPEVGLPKVAQALAPGGTVGMFWNTTRFKDWEPTQRAAVDAVYEAWMPSNDPRPIEDKVHERHLQREAMFRACGLFASVHVSRYRWSQIYAPETYLALVDTYSDHRILPETTQKPFYAALHKAIMDTGGRVELPYETVLYRMDSL